MEKKKNYFEEHIERKAKFRKAFRELEEGVDYKMVDTEIGKGNKKTYHVKKFIPITEKGKKFIKGEF